MTELEKLEQAVEGTRDDAWFWWLSSIEAGDDFDCDAAEAANFAVYQAEKALADYKEQQDNAGIRKPREDGLSPELGCYIESMLSVKG